MTVVEIEAPFTATKRQNELARAWHRDDCRVALADGAIRSGKTAAAARLLLEAAVRWPSVYVVIRESYRELEDSTKRAFLSGDGATPPLIPPQLIPDGGYRVSDNIVRLRSGSDILFRSRDDWRKWLGINLGGYLWDQAEESDADGEEAFDALRGRLSDLRGPRKGILLANPAGLTHWLYRRCVDEATADRDVCRVHFTLWDNADNLAPDYIASMEETRRTRPYWYRAFVEGTWGSFEGAAFEEFSERLHVVEPFEPPEHWLRGESLDHGAANPTAHYVWATDDDGNSIAVSEYHEPGLVSKHAEAILARRKRWYPTHDRQSPTLWADPSIFAKHGLQHELGEPASVATEYRQFGVYTKHANNDRAAGYVRMLELLHPEPGRPFPAWHPLYGETGAPRLFFFSTCKNAVAQLKSAPIAADGLDAGEAYDRKWANQHGHAVDAVRYFAMTRPSPSQEPTREPVTPDELRAAYLKERLARRRRITDDHYLSL